MKQWTERTTYVVGTLALITGCLAAQPGCGDGNTAATHPTGCNPPCGAGEQCVAGACECLAGMMRCDGACVDTASDPAHCGTCSKSCQEGEECSAGNCQCPAGQAACTSGCADIQTDTLNCGQCNVTCGAAQSCEGGQCVCPDGKQLCFDQCVDTTSDAHFCGNCQTACDDGEYCDASNCALISNCDQVNMDQYEGNDTCALARPLPNAPEGAPTPVTISDPTLHHTDHSLDTDWYSILAVEANHPTCTPLSPQCYFLFDIAFAPPDEAAYATYQMCIHTGSCGAAPICTESGDWNGTANRYEITLQWQGLCNPLGNDNRLFFVAITRNGGQESCEQYALEYHMSFTNEECP